MIGRKAFIFIGFIHYLASRKIASVRKRRGISQEVHENDEDSFTKKKSEFGRAGAPLYGEKQNSEHSFTPQEIPEKEFE